MMQTHASAPAVAQPAKASHNTLPVATLRKQLTRLIQSAKQHVPFYARHWQGIAAQLATLQFPEQLSELPIVQKTDLVAQPAADLLDNSFSDLRLVIEKTSGSGGQPMEISKDPASVRRRGLRFLRALLSCGYRPGQRLMLISTRRSGGVMTFARWHYVDLRDEQLLKEYQQLRPETLYGPLTSLLQICEQAQRDTVALHRPSMIISTGEQMMPAQRALLAATFGCPVGDFYGMTEVGLVAFRRPQNTNFELASDDLLLEYLPLEDGHTIEKPAERLIVTDLTGGAMPMIRYDTGDLVCRDTGQPERPIQGFVGRRIDSIKLGSGNSVSPYRVTLRFEAIPSLRQYQVVQRKDLSVDIYFHCEEAHAGSVSDALSTALAELCGELTTRLHFQKHALHKVVGKFRPVQSEASPAAARLDA